MAGAGTVRVQWGHHFTAFDLFGDGWMTFRHDGPFEWWFFYWDPTFGMGAPLWCPMLRADAKVAKHRGTGK